MQNVIIINCVGFEENKSQGLQYVNLGELFTVKPTFIRLRDIFMRFARASLLQIFLAADQYLPYSCNKKPGVDKA